MSNYDFDHELIQGITPRHWDESWQRRTMLPTFPGGILNFSFTLSTGHVRHNFRHLALNLITHWLTHQNWRLAISHVWRFSHHQCCIPSNENDPFVLLILSDALRYLNFRAVPSVKFYTNTNLTTHRSLWWVWLDGHCPLDKFTAYRTRAGEHQQMEIPTGANQKLDDALTIYWLSTDPLLSSTDSLLTL